MRARVAERLGRLSAEQRAVVEGIATSGRRVDVLIGYAGTGKTWTARALASTWRTATGRPVLGLTTAQTAADVLRGDGADLDHAINIARWLDKVDRRKAGLSAGQLVLVDEFSMVSTEHLARIERLARAAGAKVVLVGDDQQLAAIETGGAGRMLAERLGAHRLTEVRRFSEQWEREASVRLRAGAADVLTEYDAHGRIVGGRREQMEQDAYRGYVADYLAGYQSLLLATTNEQAAQLSGWVREDLVRAGRVDDGVTAALRDGNRVGAGDLVQARRNDVDVALPTAGRALNNRDSLRVRRVGGAGGVTADVLDEDGNEIDEIELDAGYVREEVQLGYAVTLHATQGRTVDTCHSLLDSTLTRMALYVAMTRARLRGVGYVAVEQDRQADLRSGPEQSADRAAAVLGEAADPAGAGERRTWREVLTDVIERTEPDQTAVEAMLAEAERPRHMGHLSAMWIDLTRTHAEGAWIDQAVAAGALDAGLAGELRTSGAAAPLGRLLHRVAMSGRDPHAVLAAAAGQRSMAGAEDVGRVLIARITEQASARGIELDQLTPGEQQIAGSWAERTGDLGGARGQQRADVAAAMDARTAELAGAAAETTPAWLATILGAAPQAGEPGDRLWRHRAGRVLAWREMAGVTDEIDPIGPRPSPTQPEQLAAWLSAYDALGRDSQARDVAGASIGELCRLRAAYQRAAAWAPPYVADQLRETTIQAREHEAEAVWLRAAAAATSDVTEREVWGRQAGVHAELAGELAARRDTLAEAHEARRAWLTATRDERERALRADAELRRRPGVDAAALPPLDAEADAGVEPADLAAAVAVEGQLEIDFADADDRQLELPVTGPWTGLTGPAGPEQPGPVEPGPDVEPGLTSADQAPSRRDRALAALADAAEWYRQQLAAPAGQGARGYLEGRDLGHVLAEDSLWQVGYAGTGWHDLYNHLRAAGYEDAELDAAGLVSRTRRGGLVDRFRGRIMIPIRDADGVVIGFAGRAEPGNDSRAKYVNSPASELYDKSAVLFGLGDQRRALAEGAQPALMEGYLDVIAAAPKAGRDGPAQVVPVATGGTALTDQHVALLREAADDGRALAVTFDDDAAGQRAAVRAHDKLGGWSGPVTAPELPAGTDPGDLAAEPERLAGILTDRRRLLVDVAIGADLDADEARRRSSLIAYLGEQLTGEQISERARLSWSGVDPADLDRRIPEPVEVHWDDGGRDRPAAWRTASGGEIPAAQADRIEAQFQAELRRGRARDEDRERLAADIAARVDTTHPARVAEISRGRAALERAIPDCADADRDAYMSAVLAGELPAELAPAAGRAEAATQAWTATDEQGRPRGWSWVSSTGRWQLTDDMTPDAADAEPEARPGPGQLTITGEIEASGDDRAAARALAKARAAGRTVEAGRAQQRAEQERRRRAERDLDAQRSRPEAARREQQRVDAERDRLERRAADIAAADNLPPEAAAALQRSARREAEAQPARGAGRHSEITRRPPPQRGRGPGAGRGR